MGGGRGGRKVLDLFLSVSIRYQKGPTGHINRKGSGSCGFRRVVMDKG